MSKCFNIKRFFSILFICRYRYSRRILVGLIFCCLGDAFLIWPGYFEVGMLAFAIGHINYILAFGFKPLNLSLGLCLYGVSVLGMYINLNFFQWKLSPIVCRFSIFNVRYSWYSCSWCNYLYFYFNNNDVEGHC